MGDAKALLRRLLAGTEDALLIQFFRYVLVGGLAFVVDFGGLYVLTEHAGLHYLTANALAFLLGLTTNYLLSVTWVFSRRTLDSRGREFAIFAAVGIVGLGINELVMWLLTDHAGAHYMVSKLAATAVGLLWNFGGRKALLFR
jgi:putative flippase GtrA